MTTRASFTVKNAWLSSDFGENYARKLFGDKVNELPHYVRGKRKGKLKGQILWTKCVAGGWVRTGPSYENDPSGYVERRVNKTISAQLVMPVWREQPTLLSEITLCAHTNTWAVTYEREAEE